MDGSGSHEAKPDGTSADLDLNRPSAAGIYDCLLGGYHNFEVDRAVAEQAIRSFPGTVLAAKVSRAFLRRSVQYLVNQGIEQFVDIGSGIPTVGHVQGIAQKINPNTRVVHVDIYPIAVAHSETILEGNPNARVIMEDVRHPERILAHERTWQLIDFCRPVSVLFVAILHFRIDEEEAKDVIQTFIERISPGSYVASSHPSCDGAPAELKADYDESARHITSSARHRSG